MMSMSFMLVSLTIFFSFLLDSKFPEKALPWVPSPSCNPTQHANTWSPIHFLTFTENQTHTRHHTYGISMASMMLPNPLVRSEVRLQEGGLSGPQAWAFHPCPAGSLSIRHLYASLHTIPQGPEAGLGRADGLISLFGKAI